MNDDLLPGEPEEGWVTAPTLIDTQLLVTTLCRFAGEPVSHDGPCAYREMRRHPDEECRALYFQAQALEAGLISLDKLDEVPEEVRVPFAGEAGGSDHA